jgi:hypothetical protein
MAKQRCEEPNNVYFSSKVTKNVQTVEDWMGGTYITRMYGYMINTNILE